MTTPQRLIGTHAHAIDAVDGLQDALDAQGVGNAGPPGEDGRRGERGEDGIPGVAGAAGATGASGSPGAPGATGATGAAGAAGTNGHDGPPGEWGPRGRRGEDAYPIPGAVGPAGAAGSTGAAGSQGATGAQGVPGVDGNRGARGQDGYPVPGDRGPTGATGATGPTGATGIRGDSGPPGWESTRKFTTPEMIPYGIQPRSASLANPTGTIGLSAVNGVALTGVRSDAAPALSQAIVPTWTGIHTWTRSTTGGYWVEFTYSTTPVSWGFAVNAGPTFSLDEIGVAQRFVVSTGSGGGMMFPQWVNIGAASAPTNVAAGDLTSKRIFVTQNGITTTATGALWLINETAATTSVRVQQAPSLVFRGQAWDIDNSVNRETDYRFTWVPLPANTVGGVLTLAFGINNGSYVDVITFDSSGSALFNNYLKVGGLSTAHTLTGDVDALNYYGLGSQMTTDNDGSASNYTALAYGNSKPTLNFEAYGGSRVAPDVMHVDETVGVIYFYAASDDGMSGVVPELTCWIDTILLEDPTTSSAAGRFRVETTPFGSTDPTVSWFVDSEGAAYRGYLRVGDVDNDPANETAGDLTVVRSFIGPAYSDFVAAGAKQIIYGDNGVAPYQAIAAWGSVTPYIVFLATGGTHASPAAVPSSLAMGGLFWEGWDGSAYSTGAGIAVAAQELWSGTGHGARIVFSVTPNGSTSIATLFAMNGNGMFDANAGYRTTSGTPTAGHVLRSNGSSFVDAALIAGDIPALDNTNLANRVRAFPVYMFDYTHGVSVPASDIHGFLGGTPHYDLADSVDIYLMSQQFINLPSDYIATTTGLNLCIEWSSTAAGGNVYFNFQAYSMGSASTTSNTLLSTSTAIATPAGANTITRTKVAITNAPPVSTAINCVVGRQAGSSPLSDTNTGTLSIWAVWVEYTADM